MIGQYNAAAWLLASLGAICGVRAGYLAGGETAAWAALGTALTGFAGVLGMTSKVK